MPSYVEPGTRLDWSDEEQRAYLYEVLELLDSSNLDYISGAEHIVASLRHTARTVLEEADDAQATAECLRNAEDGRRQPPLAELCTTLREARRCIREAAALQNAEDPYPSVASVVVHPSDYHLTDDPHVMHDVGYVRGAADAMRMTPATLMRRYG